MSDAGDKLKASIDAHNASIETSRKVSQEIAAERDAAQRADAAPPPSMPRPSESSTEQETGQ